LASASTINSDSGTLTLSGGISGSENLTVGGAGNTTISSAVATGSGTLTKNGSGTLILSAGNSYTGATTISSGVVNIQHADALGTTANGTTVSSGAALQIQGNITTAAEALTLNGTGISNDGALRNISGNNTYAGNVTLASATRINSDSGTLTLTGSVTGTNNLTVGGAGTTVISGNISTGSGTLTKDGLGTLTLSGTNNYSGLTTVSAGTLNVTGSLAGDVSVASGASLNGTGGTFAGTNTINGTLTGTGTYSGNTIINGLHSPGNSPGLQSFGGNLTYNNGSSFNWELISNSTTGRGTNFDAVNVGGNLLFTGATSMNLLFAGTVNWTDAFWGSNQSWLIYDVAGTTTGLNFFTISGNNWNDSTSTLLSSVRAGSSFSLSQSGSDVILQYNSGSGSQAVPEPSSLALMGVAGLLGGGRLLRRYIRRRKDAVANS
jgi:autotransporter-associated beta strand protein